MIKPLAIFALCAALHGDAPGWVVTSGGYAPWQASDKSQHFIAGFTIGTITSLGCMALGVPRKHIWWISMVAGLAAGYWKERMDQLKGFHPDAMDMANTGLGAAIPGFAVSIKW